MQILFTCDTELSCGLFQRGTSLEDNLAQSIFGRTAGGEHGIAYQMRRLSAHGHRGVFFVDPMPACIYGLDAVRPIVDAIGEAGHEVQLHLHPEWLAFASSGPMAGMRRTSIKDFTLAEQVELLARAADWLVACGAPYPTAFRAGNYGANDDTLRALATLGIGFDSSFNPAYAGSDSLIELPTTQVLATHRHGVVELPISCIEDGGGGVRHAQICALSVREMREAIDWAAARGQPHFVVVSHSFELVSRDRKRPALTSVARFEALCADVATRSDIAMVGFAQAAPSLIAVADVTRPQPERLPPDRWRTGQRQVEQLWSRLRDERRLRA